MDSTITVVGNLARDPELRFTQSGQAVASFSVAVNRRFQKNGQWEDEVSFVDVTAWGTLGENVSESLAKGDRAIVSGRIQQQSWETQQGEKRNKLVIQADCIGPDLRWSSCTVQKNDRSGPASGGQQRNPAPDQPVSSGYDDGPGF